MPHFLSHKTFICPAPLPRSKLWARRTPTTTTSPFSQSRKGQLSKQTESLSAGCGGLRSNSWALLFLQGRGLTARPPFSGQLSFSVLILLSEWLLPSLPQSRDCWPSFLGQLYLCFPEVLSGFLRTAPSLSLDYLPSPFCFGQLTYSSLSKFHTLSSSMRHTLLFCPSSRSVSRVLSPPSRPSSAVPCPSRVCL